MPYVVYDYSKCTGEAQCVAVCPVQILETSPDGKWCKAIDEHVENKEAVEAFHEKVEPNDPPVNIRIWNDMPSCIFCQACVAACPTGAIEVYESLPEGTPTVEEL